MALDPIVSLSVAIAEGPGTCAFFVGSGISRDAGVPTGGEVLRNAQDDLYRQSHPDRPDVDDDERATWLAEQGLADASYSVILEAIAPDAASRRDYLAKYFEGKAPSDTHRALADLAVGGHVRVFITTNFDRLLEQAIEQRGITVTVISTAEDLNSAVPREHAACIVFKPHGDYQQQTIRNTDLELAELQPELARELGEITNRYGLVVTGYSGSDEGIATILQSRRSRYGMWWVSRRSVAGSALRLADATHSRVILRDNALTFARDLSRRIAVYAQHPSGQTPGVTYDEVVSLLRARDEIGLNEFLRREHDAWADGVTALSRDFKSRDLRDRETAGEAWARLGPILERRLASLLPIARYDEARFSRAIRRLAESMSRRVDDGPTSAGELREFGATWLGYVVGGALVIDDELSHLTPLFLQQWTPEYGGQPQNLVEIPASSNELIAERLNDPLPEGEYWPSPFWTFLKSSVTRLEWLLSRERGFSAPVEPAKSMAIFDLMLVLSRSLNGRQAIGYFGLERGHTTAFARALHDDAERRERVAKAAGVTLTAFDEGAAQALRDLHSVIARGGFGTFALGDVTSALAGQR